MLCFPFLLFTRDEGFFKDNITVLCTRSYVNTSPGEFNYLNVEPLLEETSDVITKLDEKHIFYCRSLEGRVFKPDFNL